MTRRITPCRSGRESCPFICGRPFRCRTRGSRTACPCLRMYAGSTQTVTTVRELLTRRPIERFHFHLFNAAAERHAEKSGNPTAMSAAPHYAGWRMNRRGFLASKGVLLADQILSQATPALAADKRRMHYALGIEPC